MREGLIEVLAWDPELGSELADRERDAARRDCLAAAVTIPPGRWEPDRLRSPDPGGFGMLLLSGYVVRRVNQAGRHGSELLGPGDLLRPWQVTGETASIPFGPAWDVISELRLAVLGRAFARRASPYPGVAVELTARAMARARHLVVNLAIVQQARTESRLQMLFWHLADRWGHMGPEGVTVAVPLTHRLLSDLVAARRPTVTTALAGLKRAGVVERTPEGWLLRGGPPEELAALPVPAPAVLAQ